MKHSDHLQVEVAPIAAWTAGDVARWFALPEREPAHRLLVGEDTCARCGTPFHPCGGWRGFPCTRREP